jgi:putative hydrolase of the HAD superfamily
MHIEAIFFDLGNILVGIDGKKAINTLREETGLTSNQIATRLSNSGFEEYEMGAISTEDFFASLKEALQYRGTAAELRDVCDNIFFPIEKNIAIARSLKGTYKLGILSNTNASHIAFVENQYDFFPLFDARIYSYQVHARKPFRKIYDVAKEALQAEAAKCLFIYDLIQNVEAAQELGWQAIHLTPETDLRAALKTYGIDNARPC